MPDNAKPGYLTCARCCHLKLICVRRPKIGEGPSWTSASLPQPEPEPEPEPGPSLPKLEPAPEPSLSKPVRKRRPRRVPSRPLSVDSSDSSSVVTKRARLAPPHPPAVTMQDLDYAPAIPLHGSHSVPLESLQAWRKSFEEARYDEAALLARAKAARQRGDAALGSYLELVETVALESESLPLQAGPSKPRGSKKGKGRDKGKGRATSEQMDES